MFTRHTDRTGTTLLELLVASAILAGPLLGVVSLIHSNSSGSRFNRDRATARLVLMDLAEILVHQPLSELREKLDSGPGSQVYLRALLTRRIDRMPGPARDPYRSDSAPFLDRMTGALQVDGGAPDLARLTVRATLDRGARITVECLFRPGARERTAGIILPGSR